MQSKKDYMKKLPLLEGAKMIVIDEGSNAMYARVLIAGWMHAWIEKDCNYSIDLLSFSDPKFWYDNDPEPLTRKNVHIHDYYTIDINEVANKDLENLEHIYDFMKSRCRNTVIIDCMSSLILFVGLAKALRFIEKLSTQVPQLICIYRRDFTQNKIPAVETLGTTYVKLKKYAGFNPLNNIVYTAKLTHRKLGGSIISQTEAINQDKTTFQINAEKIETPSASKSNQADQSLKIESSFRIEMNAQEMEQRNKAPLPYTLNIKNTSKIHYQPDDVDDIDEDDPDDDLCF